jgi:hypothetical protein
MMNKIIVFGLLCIIAVTLGYADAPVQTVGDVPLCRDGTEAKPYCLDKGGCGYECPQDILDQDKTIGELTNRVTAAEAKTNLLLACIDSSKDMAALKACVKG